MKSVFRWISFLPASALVIGFAQVANAYIAHQSNWWVAGAVILFFGGVILGTVVLAVAIAPNPKIGAAIVLTLFIPLEIISLIGFIPRNTFFFNAVRVYTDVLVLLGAIGATLISRNDAA